MTWHSWKSRRSVRVGQSDRPQEPDVKEDAGNLKVSGQTEYQLDANRLWDNIKTHEGWENEISREYPGAAYGCVRRHTVVAGDSLPKLAKSYLGDGSRFMEIFNVNTGTLSNPDQIKVGQRVNIPAR